MEYTDYCPNCDYKLKIQEEGNEYVIVDNKGKAILACPNCSIKLIVENGELKEDV